MTQNLDELSSVYIPSTVERKRAIASLFFVGIMMMLLSKELSVYERYYLGLSVGLWSIGLMSFLIAILVFFLVALIGYLYVIVLLAWFGVWIFALQQAWAGIYGHDFVALRLLAGLGNWIVSLFQDDADTSFISPPTSDDTHPSV